MTRKTVPLLAASILAASAQAATIGLPADGAWYAFDVDASTSVSGGLEWIDLDGEALRFAFSLATPSILKVVDGGFGGDVFEVFDHGVSLGLTSEAPHSYPVSKGLDFAAAFADGHWSRGVFELAPGAHTITGFLHHSALDDTGAPLDAAVGAVSLTAVPIPAAWGLFLAGSALLGVLARRRSV